MKGKEEEEEVENFRTLRKKEMPDQFVPGHCLRLGFVELPGAAGEARGQVWLGIAGEKKVRY